MATVIFALCASDIATSLQLWVGYPHPNGHQFEAFLYTECAYAKCEPQGNVSDMHEFVRDIVAYGNSDICALRK